MHYILVISVRGCLNLALLYKTIMPYGSKSLYSNNTKNGATPEDFLNRKQLLSCMDREFFTLFFVISGLTCVLHCILVLKVNVNVLLL